jgi:hypothetical protein
MGMIWDGMIQDWIEANGAIGEIERTILLGWGLSRWNNRRFLWGCSC